MTWPTAWTYERFDGWDGAWDAARRRQAPVRVTIYNHLAERWIYAVVYPNGDVERHAEPQELAA